MLLLGIETSCDETAVAVLNFEPNGSGDLDTGPGDPTLQGATVLADLISSQVKLHQPYGGVVPELAAREHIKNLPVLVDQALNTAGVSLNDLFAVAVTRGPGLKGCLLVGLSYGKALAYARGIPLLALHHIEEHIFACELFNARERPIYPIVSLVVSGGHTLLVISESFRDYRLIASTRDDAAGEAFDKVATLLGLEYPGGPALSRLAHAGNEKAFRFPIGVPRDDASFSFSGLKTAVRRTALDLGKELENPSVRSDLAASVQAIIVKTLLEKTLAACKRVKPKTLLLTGGVAANSLLRERFAALAKELGSPASGLGSPASGSGIRVCIPPKRWCTDNAVMTAALGARIILDNYQQFSAWNKRSGGGKELGPGVPIGIDALARWPLEQAKLLGKAKSG